MGCYSLILNYIGVFCFGVLIKVEVGVGFFLCISKWFLLCFIIRFIGSVFVCFF